MKKKIEFNYTLDTVDERVAWAEKQIELVGELSANDKENLATYILRATELRENLKEEGISLPGRHDYSKQNISFDELAEKNYYENSFSPKVVKYKVPKPVIDREAHANLPGMKELWTQIDLVRAQLDNCTPGTRQHYQLKHRFIALSTEQYNILKEQSNFINLRPEKRTTTYLQDVSIPGQIPDFSYKNIKKILGAIDDVLAYDTRENTAAVCDTNREFAIQFDTLLASFSCDLDDMAKIIVREKRKGTGGQEIAEILATELGMETSASKISTRYTRIASDLAEYLNDNFKWSFKEEE